MCPRNVPTKPAQESRYNHFLYIEIQPNFQTHHVGKSKIRLIYYTYVFAVSPPPQQQYGESIFKDQCADMF